MSKRKHARHNMCNSRKQRQFHSFKAVSTVKTCVLGWDKEQGPSKNGMAVREQQQGKAGAASPAATAQGAARMGVGHPARSSAQAMSKL